MENNLYLLPKFARVVARRMGKPSRRFFQTRDSFHTNLRDVEFAGVVETLKVFLADSGDCLQDSLASRGDGSQWKPLGSGLRQARQPRGRYEQIGARD